MRASSERSEKETRRTCVVTGVEGDPETMLRFVLSPQGIVTPDILRKLPGRGVWTELNKETVRKAVTKKAFSRGFRAEARVDPELPDLVDRLLADDALAFLSFANKAGQVVAGAMKVEAAIRSFRVKALLQASDGSREGSEKLVRLLRGLYGRRAEDTLVSNIFSSSQMDLALGRTNVIHAAVSAGPASAALLVKVKRLVQFRGAETLMPAAQIEAARELTETAIDGLNGLLAGVIGTAHE